MLLCRRGENAGCLCGWGLRSATGGIHMKRTNKRPGSRAATVGKSAVREKGFPKAARALGLPMRPCRNSRRLRRSDRAISGPRLAAKDVDAKPANTVVYVHGIGNKPPPAVLKCQWTRPCSASSRVTAAAWTYWVNRELYPAPSGRGCSSGDQVRIDDDEMSTRAVMALSAASAQEMKHPVEREIEALTGDPARQAWLKRIAAKVSANGDVPDVQLRTRSVEAKVLPLPEPLRRLVGQTLTRAFLRDVHDSCSTRSAATPWNSRCWTDRRPVVVRSSLSPTARDR